MSRPTVGLSERIAVDRVLRSGMLAQGSEVSRFEEEFSRTLDGRHCIAVNSGTSALHLSLLAHGVGSGDEVIVPSFTFAATANAVKLTGATPVFADVDSDFFCLDPSAVLSKISARTKAVIPVHLYGHPADLSSISDELRQRNVLVIEDAAQAHSATIRGDKVGTLGHTAAFSFYPTKNMTSGEGGMVVTSDENVARSVRLLRNQGMIERYKNEIAGFNNRMTDIHAAIGRVQLRRLSANTSKRQANAKILSELLGDFAPLIRPEASHVFHQYTIKVPGEKRDEIRRQLLSLGIPSDVYYPTPVHRLPSFDSSEELVNTEELSKTVLSLPVHPRLSAREIKFIGTSARRVLNHV